MQIQLTTAISYHRLCIHSRRLYNSFQCSHTTSCCLCSGFPRTIEAFCGISITTLTYIIQNWAAVGSTHFLLRINMQLATPPQFKLSWMGPQMQHNGQLGTSLFLSSRGNFLTSFPKCPWPREIQKFSPHFCGNLQTNSHTS